MNKAAVLKNTIIVGLVLTIISLSVNAVLLSRSQVIFAVLHPSVVDQAKSIYQDSDSNFKLQLK